jgi:hypothetical protein
MHGKKFAEGAIPIRSESDYACGKYEFAYCARLKCTETEHEMHGKNLPKAQFLFVQNQITPSANMSSLIAPDCKALKRNMKCTVKSLP